MNIKALSSAVLLSCTSLSLAGTLSMMVQHKLEQERVIPSLNVEQRWFTQVLDHEHPESGQFKQRFFINEQFSTSPDDPVFFYICGEASCSPNSLNGAIKTYAQKFHAKLVALEHRFYGQSMPYKTLSHQHLTYLSTNQALADLASFQRYMQQNKNYNGVWIAFGGSYPGSLSAYYRMKYPYLVQGAIASSAPVEAKEDFIEYDAHVTKEAGRLCADKMREVVAYAENMLKDRESSSQIKNRFDATDVENDDDFLYLLADVGATAVQYGMKNEFCHALTKEDNPVQAYADFTKKILNWLHVKAIDMTFAGAISEDASRYMNGVGMRQWMWQSCTEYGYWQNAHPDETKSTRSKRINLNYHHEACERLFSQLTPAKTKEINQSFYEPLLSDYTSRIFLTNGSQDPWSNLSLTNENGHDVNPMLSYITILGTAHCDDLRQPKETDNQELKNARIKTEQLLDEWIHHLQ